MYVIIKDASRHRPRDGRGVSSVGQNRKHPFGSTQKGKSRGPCPLAENLVSSERVHSSRRDPCPIVTKP
jgi:hypothetical protein